MRRTRSAALAAFALTLASCESTTAPAESPVLDEAGLAQFAEAVAESSEVQLPSLGALLRASRAAIEAQGGNEEAVQFFRRARRLANAAETAWEAGNAEEATAYERRSYRSQLAGIVSALGTEAVTSAVAGSAAGLARVEGHLEGKTVPEQVTNAVARIAEQVAAAQDKLAADEAVAALHHALNAAEGIRSLSPRYQARKWIARATELLRQGHQAVGDAPTEAEATDLHRARRLLNVAKDEFEAGAMNRALDAARRSARLSWGVVEGRSG